MTIYFRLMVAALHFNENTSRVQAATKEGNLQYKISFPKFKHGEYSVRKRTVDPTYGTYNNTLFHSCHVIKNKYHEFHLSLWKKKTKLQ